MAEPADNQNLIACQCRWCGEAFLYDRKAVARGRGQFCSRSCAGKGKPPRPKKPLAARYERYVIRRGPNACWGWAGHRHKGYGRMRVGQRTVGAHRVSYQLHVGVIPDGLTVLHRCDNPECSNPKHLFLGTNADNNRDRDQKGRAAVGERASTSKLTEAAVRHIRRVGPRTLAEQASIGRLYGVKGRAVYLALVGRTWAHVQ